MKKALTIVAASALALGVSACGKSADTSSANVSADDNMLVPADENSAGGDLNAADAGNTIGGDNLSVDNSTAAGNSSNAM